MWRDAYLVAGKDLTIEMRSKVGLNQILPFALVVLILFAFAVQPDSAVLVKAAPGLFWITVLFAAVLATQRSFAAESANSASDGLRLSGIDPAGVFIGKATALAVELLLLEAVLVGGMAVFYGAPMQSFVLLGASAAIATVGLSGASVMYGALTAGVKETETLLPLLLLPVLAPVLLGATKTWDAALQGRPALGVPWIELLGAFAVLYLGLGIGLADSMLEVT